MLGTLLTPRWLGGIAAAIAFAVVTVLLGNWQWSRHEDALAHRDLVEAHYDATPVPLVQALDDGAQEWTRVTAAGAYDPSDQLLVRNRPLDGHYGYEVLVPLRVDGRLLAVNRGWVPNAASAATTPEVPLAPDGEVTVTGWLRHGEPDLGRDLPAGQLASINLSQAQTAWGEQVLPVYLVLESEVLPSGVTPERPTPLERPDTSLGVHLAYALQWWLSSVVGFVMVWVFARREHLAGKPRTERVKVPATRTRIWDEEDA